MRTMKAWQTLGGCTHGKFPHSNETKTAHTAHQTYHVHTSLSKHITKSMCAAAYNSTSGAFPNVC